MSTCLSSLSPTVTAVPRDAHPSSKQSSASHALVPSYSLSAHILSSQPTSSPVCSLSWSIHLFQLQKASLGSLSSQGASASRVVIPAGELWRGGGVCSWATHSLACAQGGWKPRCILLLTLTTTAGQMWISKGFSEADSWSSFFLSASPDAMLTFNIFLWRVGMTELFICVKTTKLGKIVTFSLFLLALAAESSG